MRKQLFIKRNKVCDLSLALALAGLIFVVVDAELTALSADTNITKVINAIFFFIYSLKF